MANENRLSGESCSYTRKDISHSESGISKKKSENQITYLLQGDFPYLARRCSWYYGLIG